MTARWRGSAGLHDARVLGEAFVAIVVTWLLLGWSPAHAITQIDGSQLVMPYLRGSLAAGPDWTHYLYRFGVIGGSEMHPFGGTMPIVQLCAAAGASTTTCCNVVTWFAQLALAFFAIVAIESLATVWRAAPVRLAAHARVVTVWLVAFAPLVGWRLGVGHENLILGLLPFVATLALMLAASAGRITVTALAFATFAVANGVSGLGAQTVVYGALFGAPLAVAAIVIAPRGQRWTRARWQAIAALAAGALVVLPRVAPMIAHVTGDDATRGLGSSVIYTDAVSSARDWLASIPWTAAPALQHHPFAEAHEYNFPLGPLAVFLVALWPRGKSRGLLWAAIGSAIVAIALADHVSPVADWLLAALPPLDAFRVPSRAILPVAIVLPTLALAAWHTATADHAATPRNGWLGVVAGAAIVLVGDALPTWACEAVAWLACVALVVGVHRAPAWFAKRSLAAALAPIAALGVVAFHSRIPRDVPLDTIDDGPARVHDAVLAQVPDASDPLVRVEIPLAPDPFRMSLAWAARIGSIDGVFYPPRRYLELFSAVVQRPVLSTTCNFEMTRAQRFPIWQQLYDVVAEVKLDGDRGDVLALPPTPGPAWFPSRLDTLPDAAAVGAALRAPATPGALHDAIAGTAWLSADDSVSPPVHDEDAACARAAVHRVAAEPDSQIATLDVDAPADCVLVVSTNYASILHATATAAVGGETRDVPVFPVDIALAGIAVPRGTTTVTLAPRVVVPAWAYVLAALGALLLAAALAACARRPVVSPAG